jgi:hypothetical protein
MLTITRNNFINRLITNRNGILCDMFSFSTPSGYRQGTAPGKSNMRP